MIEFALFTGAGFSKDWGGLLTSEMTARILSSRKLDGQQIIRKMLLKANYEVVLAEVRTEYRLQATDERRTRLALLTEAIDEAYEFQEHILERHHAPSTPSLVKLIQELLDPYRGRSSMWFTLNHDLLIEKYWKRIQIGGLICPGIPTYEGVSHVLPRTDEVSEFHASKISGAGNEHVYLKLHGSMNWTAEIGGIKQRVMIAGAAKRKQIARMEHDAGDLLRSYLDFFEHEVGKGTTVLVIGYSFSDDHINRVLAKPGVRLFLIDPAGYPKNIAGNLSVVKSIQDNLIGLWPLGYRAVFGTVGEQPSQNEMVADLRKLLSIP